MICRRSWRAAARDDATVDELAVEVVFRLVDDKRMVDFEESMRQA